MNKLTLGILFGGASSEHDISCISAKSILENIDKEKYNIVMLGITKQGEWFLFDDDVTMLPNDKWLKSKSLKKAYITPDSKIHGIVTEDAEQIRLDAVFPVLHGKNGEDGTVQGLLQSLLLPIRPIPSQKRQLRGRTRCKAEKQTPVSVFFSCVSSPYCIIL